LPGEGWEAPACRRLLMLPPVRWQAKRDARGNSEVGGGALTADDTRGLP